MILIASPSSADLLPHNRAHQLSSAGFKLMPAGTLDHASFYQLPGPAICLKRCSDHQAERDSLQESASAQLFCQLSVADI